MNEIQTKSECDKWLYPVLGVGCGNSKKIILIAPSLKDSVTVKCELFSNGMKISSQEQTFKDAIVRVFEYEFCDLIPGVKYNYIFSENGKVLELGGGLEQEDLFFVHWNKIEGTDSVLLMSCNGVNFYSDERKKWNMWEELNRNISNSKIKPQLLILGGDQYYQDTLEEKWIKKLNNANFGKIRDEFKRDCLNNILLHMENLSYRKTMAQIPSVAMLDDHDITDGAGGRDEHFIGTSDVFTEEYSNYFSVQKELFQLIQATRNPPPILKKDGAGFSTIVNLGETAIVLLDLRTEKNSRQNKLMEPDSKEALFTAMRELPHKKIMILSPVVPLRNSSKVEGGVHLAIYFLSKFLQYVPKLGKFGAKIKPTIEFITGLEDDLNDSLSSECNKNFFSELLHEMGAGAKAGVSYAILSGDIHTGGTVELFVKADGYEFRVPLIISSPIGYQTMNPIVETFLRGKHVISYSHANAAAEGRNNLFTTNRNYIQLTPNKLFSNPNESVLLFEEELPGYQILMTQFWFKNESVGSQLNVADAKEKSKSRQLEATL